MRKIRHTDGGRISIGVMLPPFYLQGYRIALAQVQQRHDLYARLLILVYTAASDL